MTTLFIVLLVAAILVAVMLTGPSTASDNEPAPFTRADPRCRDVEQRLDDARRAMIGRGTPLLLDAHAPTHKPWKRGNVVELRR